MRVPLSGVLYSQKVYVSLAHELCELQWLCDRESLYVELCEFECGKVWDPDWVDYSRGWYFFLVSQDALSEDSGLFASD